VIRLFFFCDPGIRYEIIFHQYLVFCHEKQKNLFATLRLCLPRSFGKWYWGARHFGCGYPLYRRKLMKKWILSIGATLACLVVAAAGGGYLWFQHVADRGLPQIAGEIQMSGINEPVEIIRDTYGVPHIFARNEPDLYFAFGYAMAQDRLWQMEFTRRLGQGRLSEIFGPDFVKADRYFRTLTAAGVNHEMPEACAPLWRAFANGINAYLKDHKDRLPIEFTLLRYEPEPWHVDD